jgi:hypothetical protein
MRLSLVVTAVALLGGCFNKPEQYDPTKDPFFGTGGPDSGPTPSRDARPLDTQPPDPEPGQPQGGGDGPAAPPPATDGPAAPTIDAPAATIDGPALPVDACGPCGPCEVCGAAGSCVRQGKRCSDGRCIPDDQCCDSCGPCKSCQGGSCQNDNNAGGCTGCNSCSGGACRPDTSKCSGCNSCQSGACAPDNSRCGANQRCEAGTCRDTCTPGLPCPSSNPCREGRTTCPSGCNTSTPRPDGTGCPGGECLNGTCCAGTGRQVCDDQCVDVRSNSNHCGSCGNRCPSSRSACRDGVCSCPSGQQDCSGRCAPSAARCCNVASECGIRCVTCDGNNTCQVTNGAPCTYFDDFTQMSLDGFCNRNAECKPPCAPRGALCGPEAGGKECCEGQGTCMPTSGLPPNSCQ